MKLEKVVIVTFQGGNNNNLDSSKYFVIQNILQLEESLKRKILTSFTSDPLCQVKLFILVNEIFCDWYLQIAASLNGVNFNPKAVAVLTDYFWQCDTGIVHPSVPHNQLHCAPAKLCIYF